MWRWAFSPAFAVLDEADSGLVIDAWVVGAGFNAIMRSRQGPCACLPLPAAARPW